MLRTKLILIVAAAVVALQVMGVAFSAWAIYQRESENLIQTQERNLRTAANVLDLRYPEMAVTYNRDDTIKRMNLPEVEKVTEHRAMRQIGAITGATATLFAFEPKNGDFWRRTTNIFDTNGAPIVGTELGLDHPAHAVVSRGEIFGGEATVVGKDYLVTYQPIFDVADERVIGILYVGTNKASLYANVRSSIIALVVQAGVIVLATVALVWLLLSWSLAGLGRLQGATRALASGQRDLTVPEQGRRDELGLMASDLEALRGNLSAAETAQARATSEEETARENLCEMMTKLDREVSSVVQAVGSGDLTRSIATRFDQPELQSLAEAVNGLRDRVQGFVGDIGATLRAMATGDLTREMPKTYSGAFGQIAGDANETLDRLGGVLGEVLAAIEENQRGVALIDRASIDLGSRVEEQAAALQETAATMEQMAASVKSNAVSLHEAEGAANKARATTRSGASAATAAVEAVGRIAESSNQIAEILKVIDSIAFQTNLLALNAAVEAARAGDAGKGFAVVANEVGNLARQSSEAARDIGELVTRNQGSVDEGVDMVKGAGAALEQIDDEITRLSERVTAVSLAGREQSTGIEEVNRAVAGLDQMTQENATLTESTASQVATLSREMARLVQIVSTLRIRGAATGASCQMSIRSAA